MNWWSVFYGLLILLLGLSIMLLIYYITRILPNRKRSPETTSLPLSKAELVDTEAAVLLIGSGGRVVYANALAKDWFGYSSGVPNLERLLQRTQPKDVLLSLCTHEGQARFSIDGRLTEGVSHAIPSGSNGGQNGHSEDRAILVMLRRPNIVFDERFWGGISYRIQDAIALLMGMEMENGLRFGYSFDLVTSVIGRYGYGSHEIFVGYSLDLEKNRNQKYKSIRFL